MSSSFLKDSIAQALILLLEHKELDEISISEIVLRAGVNRSTYYRHYHNKQEVVRHYYACLLDMSVMPMARDITLREYFIRIFETFRAYKKELLLLDARSLSHLLLDEMNARIYYDDSTAETSLNSFYCSYHVGGVFNSFCFWLREGMATSPEDLADRCLAILPAEFTPMLAVDVAECR